MTRDEVLINAKTCVSGDRESDYGTPERNFKTIALLKIARIASGHAKMDNWIDLAGYAACGGELESAEPDE